MKLAIAIIAVGLVGCSTSPQKQVQQFMDKPVPPGTIGVSYNCQQTQQDMSAVGRDLSLSSNTKWALHELGFYEKPYLYVDQPGIYEINKIVYTVDCRGTSKLGRSITRWNSAKLDELTVNYTQREEAKRKEIVDSRNARLKQAGVL